MINFYALDSKLSIGEEMMSVLDEIREIMEDHDLEVTLNKNTVIGLHSSVPIILKVYVGRRKASIELEAEEDLRDVLDELVESGEDIESLVDDVLSELRDIAIEIGRALENKGYRVELNLREGENDVRDIVEEVTEEYEEVLEEELGIGEEEF